MKAKTNQSVGICQTPRLALCVSLFLWTALVAVNATEGVGDVKPGDTIGPHNWQRVEGMVGENLLRRIKEGYTFKIKEPTHYQPPEDYVDATRKYADTVRLAANGGLLNYVAGKPFPEIDPKDPTAGLKLAWNFYWRWLGDDHKTGGGTETEQIISDVIEKSGSERRGKVTQHVLRTRARITLEPKPFIPGYNHIDWMSLRADEYPRDTSGITTLEIRYTDPEVEDDIYVYIPSIRRIRRVPPIQRCSTLAPTEFNFDDIKSFNGKLTNFNYKLLGEQSMLANYGQERAPFLRQQGDYLPVDEQWEVRNVYVLEITPKDPDYCYPKKLLYIDKETGESNWVKMWDKDGRYWKEQFAFKTPAPLSDGHVVWNPGTIVIVNVQNGRSTVLTATRHYNQGYKPTLFSLATLQKVLRGGSIR